MYLIVVLTVFMALATSKVEANAQVDSNLTCVLKPIGSPSELKLNQINFNNCTIANFNAAIELHHHGQIDLNDGVVNSTSICGDSVSKLVVDFNCTQLVFHMKKSENFSLIQMVDGFFNLNITNNAQRIFFSTDFTKNTFNVSNDDYYKCSSSQSLNITSTNKPPITGLVNISNFEWEAFRDKTKPSFYKHQYICPLDSQQSENDWVRIAVFICLVALVVIVLVAYFIGRRRWSERSSYESV